MFTNLDARVFEGIFPAFSLTHIVTHPLLSLSAIHHDPIRIIDTPGKDL